MTSNNVPQRINTFQGARFIFALFIFLSHCVMANLNTFEFGGECGVAFFFTLSGFVLSWGYGRNVQERTFHHRRFLWRHLSDLYPLHLLLFIIVLAFDLKADYHYDAVQLLTNLLLLQSWCLLTIHCLPLTESRGFYATLSSTISFSLTSIDL